MALTRNKKKTDLHKVKYARSYRVQPSTFPAKEQQHSRSGTRNVRDSANRIDNRKIKLTKMLLHKTNNLNVNLGVPRYAVVIWIMDKSVIRNYGLHVLKSVHNKMHFLWVLRVGFWTKFFYGIFFFLFGFRKSVRWVSS